MPLWRDGSQPSHEAFPGKLRLRRLWSWAAAQHTHHQGNGRSLGWGAACLRGPEQHQGLATQEKGMRHSHRKAARQQEGAIMVLSWAGRDQLHGKTSPHSERQAHILPGFNGSSENSSLPIQMRLPNSSTLHTQSLAGGRGCRLERGSCGSAWLTQHQERGLPSQGCPCKQAAEPPHCPRDLPAPAQLSPFLWKHTEMNPVWSLPGLCFLTVLSKQRQLPQSVFAIIYSSSTNKAPSPHAE